MPDLSLDLRNLRYVLAVMEQGSFRQAASKLDLPQSTVSRRVAQLEDRLGISIFDRDHRGVRLTSAGQRFVDEALVGAQHFTNAVGAMRAMRHGQTGQLRLGFFTSLRNEFLRTLISEYHQSHPEIECHFMESSSQALVGGVLDGRLDIAFVSGSPVAPRCEATVLGEEHLYVAERKMRGQNVSELRIELAALKDKRFIVTKSGRGPDIEDFLVARLSRPGFRPRIQVHDVSFETLLHMVALGIGTAIVSQGAVSIGGPISFRALARSESKVTSSAIWLKANTNPALRPLLKLAKRLLAAKTAGENRGLST
jgi:DNA-binding transcriptional LysR family regulator